MGNFNVKEYFENKKAKEEAKKDILNEMRGNGKGISNDKRSFSAADVNVRKATFSKALWPHHEEDEIDRIVKKERYSDWQNRKYPVKVSFPEEARVRQVRTTGCTIVHAERMKDPISIRPVDENYDRKRIAAD